MYLNYKLMLYDSSGTLFCYHSFKSKHEAERWIAKYKKFFPKMKVEVNE